MMNHEDLAAFIQECRSRGRRDELKGVLSDLFAADPGNQEIQMNLGIESIASGDAQTALSLLAPLTEDRNFGGQLQATLELGHLYQAAGDFDQAESYYLRGKVNFPTNHWPAIDLSLLAMARGRPGAAIEALREGFNCSDAYGRALLLQRAASLNAQSHFNAAYLSPDWADKPVQELNGLGHACLMIMMKDEQDIIVANLEHHYAMGFRTFCLIDNLSTDNTTAVITAFRVAHPEAFIVTTIDPIRGYYQSNKMQVFTDFMLEYCKIADRRIDWIFYVDADEFLSFMGGQDHQSLSAALSDPAKSVLWSSIGSIMRPRR